MICIFPDPYPDELLYSVCARYKDLMQYPNGITATHDFFGEAASSAVPDLPNKLEYLISALPSGHRYTVDAFIDHHTMFSFYAPFLSCERARLVRTEMGRVGENRIFERIGNPVSFFARPACFRFCPACVEEDRRKFGETYWHRIHQLSGIEVCPLHTAFLEASSAPFAGCRSHIAISAESVVRPTPLRLLNLRDDFHNKLLTLARNAAWLLKWKAGRFGTDFLRERYYNHLLRLGLAYYNRRVRTHKVVTQFSEYWAPLLSSFGCEIEDIYVNWLIRLLQPGLTRVSYHPIAHILLILFMGFTTKDFFTSFEEFKPFGDGPWPCLNHAAEHFSQSVITECRITDNMVKGKLGRPLGIFSCTCGFVYNRVGPDESEQDRRRIGMVETYGPVWEETLRAAWVAMSLPLREVARRLGVSELTVVRHAIRFGLPMNAPNARQVSAKTIARYKNYRPSRKEMVEQYRAEWLSVLKTNPRASRQQLITIASFLYLWLNKNDSEWLAVHLPPVRKVRYKAELKDWKSIDVELAAAIAATATRIREAAGRPTRITLAAISREVGHKSWLEFRLGKLPLTSNALENCLESVEEFLIRRVNWTKEYYSQKGICPARSYFEADAGTRHKSGKMPAVQSAIDTALERLRERLPLAFSPSQAVHM